MNLVDLLLAARKRGTILVFLIALSAVGAIASPEGARADGSSAGVVSFMMVNQQIGNMVFIAVTGQPSNKPSCQTNTTYQFVLSLSSPAARQMYAMLQSSKSQTGGTRSFPLDLVGAGTCNTYAGVEDLIYVLF
jgi:hypothetical protein